MNLPDLPNRRGVTARVPVHIAANARRALAAEGWSVEAAIVAFLATIATDADVLLPLIAAHRPAPRPPGRPRTRRKN